MQIKQAWHNKQRISNTPCANWLTICFFFCPGVFCHKIIIKFVFERFLVPEMVNSRGLTTMLHTVLQQVFRVGWMIEGSKTLSITFRTVLSSYKICDLDAGMFRHQCPRGAGVKFTCTCDPCCPNTDVNVYVLILTDGPPQGKVWMKINDGRIFRTFWGRAGRHPQPNSCVTSPFAVGSRWPVRRLNRSTPGSNLNGESCQLVSMNVFWRRCASVSFGLSDIRGRCRPLMSFWMIGHLYWIAIWFVRRTKTYINCRGYAASSPPITIMTMREKVFMVINGDFD